MDDAQNIKSAEEMSTRVPKRGRKPGRKGAKSDMKVKLERSRQSARECRARKKLRYQYLEDLAASAEESVMSLRKEVEQIKEWTVMLDRGEMADGLKELMDKYERTGSFDDNKPLANIIQVPQDEYDEDDDD